MSDGQGRIVTVHVALLGPLEVRAESGATLEVGGARLRTLLILLALEPGRVVTTRRLIDGLWAAEPPAAAANALQALVSRLRRALPEGAVKAEPAGYRLAIEPAGVDVARFEQLVTQARAAGPEQAVELLREADALWRGPALADAEDAEFARAPRARLEELRRAATEDRIAAELTAHADPAPLIAELEAMVAAQPLRERVTSLLMRALLAAGRSADALAAFQRLRERLADELGTDPSAELARQHVNILRGAPQGPSKGNVKAPLTSFVGRSDAVRKVGKLVAESRLTTLIGPGGAGKTRLAVEAGRALGDTVPDGVWLVELAPLTDPAEVPQAVVIALGLRDQSLLSGNRRVTSTMDDSGQRLAFTIGDRDALILLDNCEHLIDASARLAEALLGWCPKLRILATSREALGVTGETLVPIEPLADEAALRLLLDRGSAVRPGLVLDESTAEPLTRICRALDGMPLAVELAAARLSALTPQQVADRLDDRFRLLTKGSRTALPRHQTLRAVVDWSWELLDAPERMLLRRLSVFIGGFTAETAAAVCDLAPDEALDGLTALADRSLLVSLEAPGRFTMLETIRAYGLERLREAGEEQPITAAHLQYFLALARSAEPHLRQREQLDWLARLTAEHDNLMGALRRAIAAGDTGHAVGFIGAMGWYWWLRGHRAEGTEVAAQALELPGGVDDEPRAVAYGFAAMMGFDTMQDLHQLRDWFDAGLAIADKLEIHTHPILSIARPMRQLMVEGGLAAHSIRFDDLLHAPDPWTRAIAYLVRAHGRLNLGLSTRAAERDFKLSLDGFTELGERWGLSFTLSALGELQGRRGDHRAAIEHLEQALTYLGELGAVEDKPQVQVRLAQEYLLVGDRRRADATLEAARESADRIGVLDGIGYVKYAQAEFARFDGDLDQAHRLYRAAASLIAEHRVSPQLSAMLESGRATLDAQRGDLQSAREHIRRAFNHAMSSYDAPVIGWVLDGLATIAGHEGDPRRAAMLLAAADTIRPGPDHTLLSTPNTRAVVHAALTDEELAEAAARGATATLDNLPTVAGFA
jgi:predicted ATPase/DNA-binding SARP family transcriptional activator